MDTLILPPERPGLLPAAELGSQALATQRSPLPRLPALPSGFAQRSSPVRRLLTRGELALLVDNAEAGIAPGTSPRIDFIFTLVPGLGPPVIGARERAAAGNFLIAAGIVFGRRSQLADSINCFRQALTFYGEHDWPVERFLALNRLHGALWKQALALSHTDRRGARATWESARQVGELVVAAFGSHLGVPGNAGAHRVEQGEIGYSATEPLGVDNINECVALAVRNRSSGMVAVAHVDISITEESLVQALHGMRRGAGEALEARLLGARFPGGLASAQALRAAANAQKVQRCLERAEVTVLSADLFDPDQPRSFVVDPEDFVLRHEVPARPHDQIVLSFGNIADSPRALRVAFDLKAGALRDRFAVTAETVQKLLTHFQADPPWESTLVRELDPFAPEFGSRAFYAFCHHELALAVKGAVVEGGPSGECVILAGPRERTLSRCYLANLSARESPVTHC